MVTDIVPAVPVQGYEDVLAALARAAHKGGQRDAPRRVAMMAKFSKLESSGSLAYPVVVADACRVLEWDAVAKGLGKTRKELNAMPLDEVARHCPPLGARRRRKKPKG